MNSRNGNRTTDRLGVVQTEADKQRALEEARRRQEEKDKAEADRKAAQEKAEKDKEKKKENSIANKTLKNLKTFFKKMVEEEE